MFAAMGAVAFLSSMVELAELNEMPDLNPSMSPIREALARLTPEEVKTLYDQYTEKNQQLHDSGRKDEYQAHVDQIEEEWPGLMVLPAFVEQHATDSLGMPEELARQRAIGAAEVIGMLFDLVQTETMPPLE